MERTNIDGYLSIKKIDKAVDTYGQRHIETGKVINANDGHTNNFQWKLN